MCEWVQLVLELAGLLPFEIYNRMGAIRNVRNGWMHEMKAPTESDSHQAVVLAVQFCSGVLEIDLTGMLTPSG